MLLTGSAKGQMQAPIDTSSLRSSNRANKYGGFRVTPPTDSRPSKSKVKPRLVPTIAGLSSISEGQYNYAQDDVVPPPTIIPAMHAIGTQLYAIPAEALSVNELTKEKEGSASSN